MFSWLKQSTEKNCIRCGYCVEVCPAHLLPQQLLFFSQSEDFNALDDYRLNACIECGACEKACPSEIALVDYFRQAKQAIEQISFDKKQAIKARQLFERRNLRIAKIEQEKAARRQARLDKKAAKQEAKLSAAAIDPVLLALKNAQEKQIPVAEKTEQMTSQADTLKDRIQRLNQKLNQTKEGPSRQIMRKTLDNLRLQLSELEGQLPDPHVYSDDPVTAALQRANKQSANIPEAKQPVAQNPKDVLEKRLQTLTQKLSEKQQNEPQSPAIDVMQKAIAEIQQELNSLP